jgi:hypothetical protein
MAAGIVGVRRGQRRFQGVECRRSLGGQPGQRGQTVRRVEQSPEPSIRLSQGGDRVGEAPRRCGRSARSPGGAGGIGRKQPGKQSGELFPQFFHPAPDG